MLPQSNSLLKCNKFFYSILGFVSATGLAVDSQGNLFNSRIGSEVEGYPISLIALMITLFVGVAKLAASLFKHSKKNMGLAPIVLFVIFLSAFLIVGQFQFAKIDLSHFAKYSIWLFSLLAGLLISNDKSESSYFRGLIFASYFIVIINLVDIVLEFIDCGVILCGAGRVAPGFGLPGIYQEYIYLPTLIVFLLVFKYFFNGLHSLHFFSAALVVVLTGSREGLFLFLAVFFLVVLYEKRRLIPLLICIFLFLLLSYQWFDMELSLISKLNDIGKELSGNNSRMEIFKNYLSYFSDNIIFGNFFYSPSIIGGNFHIDQPSAHNNYIDILGAGGLYLGILYFPIFGFICLLLFNIRTRQSIGLLIFFVSFLFISMNVNVPLRAPIVSIPLFIALGIVMARIRIKY